MGDENEQHFNSMGTKVQLVVHGYQAALGLSLARNLIEVAESRWSRFDGNSELSQMNRFAGNPTIVSDETFRLLSSALRGWAATDGAFDPSVGAAMTALGYDRDFEQLDHRARAKLKGSQPNTRPRAVDVAAASPADIVMEPTSLSVCLPSGLQLDFGGIAKGATADIVATSLGELDLDGFCVNIGGDLRVAGRAPGGEPWTIELDCPGASPSEDRPSLILDSGAVCTSATTKRRWRSSHGTSHHLIDPSTGLSRVNGPLSVTVVAGTATAAEILTKALMAGQSIEGFGATGLVVEANGEITRLPGLADFVGVAA